MPLTRLSRVLVGALLLAAACCLVASRPARAVADLTLLQCDNAGLHLALEAINAAGGGSLTFNCPTEPAIISVADGTGIAGTLPSITTAIVIDGENTITLSGGNAWRIFYITGSGSLTLRNLRVTRGYASGDGGAIYNEGTLAIENSIFTNNVSTTASGGAIVTYGPTTITNSEFAFNKAVNGGAIYPRWGAGVVTISNSRLHHNETTSTTGLGGALLLWDGPKVTIQGSSIYSNTGGYGGAFYVLANSVLTVTTSTVADNATAYDGSALVNLGTTFITSSLLRSNGNSAGSGGCGLTNSGTLTLRNSTVTESTGSAFCTTGTVRIIHSTITNNSSLVLTAGCPISSCAGTYEVRNSILADNGRNCRLFSPATVISQGFNISDDNTCTLSAGGDFPQNTNPLLAPLANNGGPTRTQALLADSPALDGAQCMAGVLTDQRGVARPQGSACDVGALEVGFYGLMVTKAGQGTVTGGPIACGVTCSAGNLREGTQIVLSATPAAGEQFVGWSGACTGAGACTVTMAATSTVGATFTTVGQPPLAPRVYLPTVRR